MENPIERVGAYLREKRLEKGLSAAKCAVELRTYEATIYRIEAGQTDTRASLLLRYAALVEATGNELIRLYNEECTCEGAAA